uniref:CHCH domain-containing protein n=1 Tax=Mucochytrium quahogii TaxID=96639 RepID=A0A7S2RA97_9STRA|mmetsp:Transcript_20553/g.33951  ORF Transcript_20553/g.33951 Transcript_20553/m.33951 type:complete len:181 (-) Transcript_20553:75-617(-)
MGSSQSSDAEDGSYSGNDEEFIEDDDFLEEDDELEASAGDPDAAGGGGFNIIFSPELVKKLQGVYDSDDEADLQGVEEDDVLEEEEGEEVLGAAGAVVGMSNGSTEPAKRSYFDIAREEDSAVAELAEMLESTRVPTESVEKEDPCSVEKSAWLDCIKANDFSKCTPLSDAFEKCVVGGK